MWVTHQVNLPKASFKAQQAAVSANRADLSVETPAANAISTAKTNLRIGTRLQDGLKFACGILSHLHVSDRVWVFHNTGFVTPQRHLFMDELFSPAIADLENFSFESSVVFYLHS